MRSLGLVVVLSLALVAACEGRRRPDMLAVVVESFGQAQCAPVPLQLIDVRSDSTRLGPADRYVSIAVSPTGEQVAAGRMDFNLCGPRPEDEGQTFTLVTIDTETLEVTEHRTTAEVPMYLHWSPDERQLALVEQAAVVIYDLVEQREVARGPRETRFVASRVTTYWPSHGQFLFLYFANNELIGIPRDGNADPQRWFLDCGDSPSGSPRSIAESDGRPEVLYSCEPTSRSAGRYRAVTLDLDDGELGAPRPARERLDDEVNRTSEMTSNLRAEFPGGRIGWTYRSDSTGRALIYTTTYSRAGIDLVEALSDGMTAPDDLETVIAIGDLNESLRFLPVELRHDDDEDFTVGPLVDIAILD